MAPFITQTGGYVDVRKRTILTPDDELGKITNMLDWEGTEITDPNEAVVVVGQLVTGQWITIDLRPMEEGWTH